MAAAAAVIFDASTPQVVSASPGYVGLVLIGYLLPGPRAALALALLATPLIIIGHWILIPGGTPEWESWLNRAFSVGAVWLTGGFVWLVRSLEKKLRWLASIVEYSADAIVSTNLHGITISWNMSAEQIFGYVSEEVIGTPITILVPPEHQHEKDLILERIRRGDRTEYFETICRRRDGRLVDVSMTISPMRDVDGKVVGASRIARDITARKKREERDRLLMGEINHAGSSAFAAGQVKRHIRPEGA